MMEREHELLLLLVEHQILIRRMGRAWRPSLKKEEDAEEEERRVRYFDRGLNNCERDLQKKKIFDKRDADW